MPVPEIAERVCTRGVYERDVGANRALEDVWDAVDHPLLLPLGQECPRADGSEEAGDAGAPGANRLGERPLRDEGRLDLSGVHRADRFGVRREE